MAPRKRPSAQRWLDRQRRAVERLRKELMSVDDSLGHPYFRALERELADFEEVVTPAELHAAAGRADVVYVGDFHAVPACQEFAADVLAGMMRRTSRVALGIEFVYTRQQRLLDRRQQGEIDDPQFLRRIHYREEWGYPWGGYGRLLDRGTN